MLRSSTARWRGALALAALLLTCTCGTVHSGRPAAVDTGPALPVSLAVNISAPLGLLEAPQQMLARAQGRTTRGASYFEADLQQDATDFEPGLPHNRVADTAPPKVEFTPVWGAPGKTLADMAYCVYYFNVVGYDRNAQVRIGWSGEPDSPGLWFAGLANWDHNRWDWYAGTASGSINLATMEPYFDFGDNLLLIVACIDDGLCVLAEVRLGGLPPVAALSASRTSGPVPLSVSFDASASTAVEGAIIDYRWDFEGDGTYELDSGTDATVDHTYMLNTECNARVRVENTLHASDTAAVVINSVGEWHHTWHRADYDRINDIAVDTNGEIYAVGRSTCPGGSFNSVMLMRISSTGELRWVRAWDAVGEDEGLAVGLPSDGTIVLAGSYSGGAANEVLLQKWSKTGNLLWSRHHGGDSTDQATELLVDGNQLYVCGTTLSTAAFWDYDYFVLSCGGDGIVQWLRSRDNHEDEDRATSMCFTGDAVTGVEGVALVGSSISPDGTGAWMVEYAVDGSLTRARELGAPPWQVRPGAIIYSRNPMTLETRYYVTGELLSEDKAFIHASDYDGIVQYATRVLLPEPVTTTRMCYGRNSDILVCGTWEAAAADHGAVLRFDYATGELLQARYFNSGANTSSLGAIAETQYGIVFGGSARTHLANMGLLALDSNGFGVNWIDAAGQPSSPVWTNNTEIAGTVFDTTADYLGNEDATGGQLSLLYHMPIP